MSIGNGKDSVRLLGEKRNQLVKRNNLGTDEFAQAIARIAVAQICESFGFQSFQQSALDKLADVGVRYIKQIGKTACFHSNLANRSQCNVFDVIRGLEDLNFCQGFSGASDVTRPLSGSGVVRDMIRYVGQEQEIPFAYLVPVFPVVKKRALNHSFHQVGENPPAPYIPRWLPKFPDPEACADSGSLKEQNSEKVVVNKIHQVDEQHRKVARHLVCFQQKLLNSGFDVVAVEQGDDTKAQSAAERNTFLAPPLQFSEKEMSLPVLPAKILDESVRYHQNCEGNKNHLCLVEPSTQANDIGRSDRWKPEDRGKILLNGRASVNFKFGNDKKYIGVKKIPRWFEDDHDGEEKETRTGKVLLENSEHPLEASHL